MKRSYTSTQKLRKNGRAVMTHVAETKTLRFQVTQELYDAIESKHKESFKRVSDGLKQDIYALYNVNPPAEPTEEERLLMEIEERRKRLESLKKKNENNAESAPATTTNTTKNEPVSPSSTSTDKAPSTPAKSAEVNANNTTSTPAKGTQTNTRTGKTPLSKK